MTQIIWKYVLSRKTKRAYFAKKIPERTPLLVYVGALIEETGKKHVVPDDDFNTISTDEGCKYLEEHLHRAYENLGVTDHYILSLSHSKEQITKRYVVDAIMALPLSLTDYVVW